ncbi:MAG: glycosyltransferase family 2 protein [Candidatus Levybacteria bacterium]|nr:glycosyltransferase family 2 protein [Candidatus Levybacteria bacterium]
MNKSKQTKPLVSVILPVFKSERFLEDCLVSLSCQSYKNIEIIAVVDYLGDKSLKILKKYKKIDKRLRVYANLQRYGLASSLNRLIRLSKGDYIAFMDPNGIAMKSRVTRQVSFLRKNPKVAAIGSQTTLVDENNKKLVRSEFPKDHEEIYAHLIAGDSMKFETVMVEKTRLPKDILKFKKNTHYPFVYAEVFMKIGLYKELANLGQNLVVARIRSEKKQLINIKKKFSFIKLLFESTTVYEYKPSIRSLFYPIIKQG